MYDYTLTETRRWIEGAGERAGIVEIKKSQFMERVIMGIHPKMVLLSTKYSRIVGKADNFSGLFACEEEMIKGLVDVAKHLFTVQTIDGEWYEPHVTGWHVVVAKIKDGLTFGT